MDFGKRSREVLKASWIPIEVKFPEHEQVVLISAQNRPDTMIATYREDTEGGAFYPPFGNASYTEYDVFVTAWMPLPEPYRESEDTENSAFWKNKVMRDFMKGEERLVL